MATACGAAAPSSSMPMSPADVVSVPDHVRPSARAAAGSAPPLPVRADADGVGSAVPEGVPLSIFYADHEDTGRS